MDPNQNAATFLPWSLPWRLQWKFASCDCHSGRREVTPHCSLIWLQWICILAVFLGPTLCLGDPFYPVSQAFPPFPIPACLLCQQAWVRRGLCMPVQLCVTSCGRVCSSHTGNRLSLGQPGSLALLDLPQQCAKSGRTNMTLSLGLGRKTWRSGDGSHSGQVEELEGDMGFQTPTSGSHCMRFRLILLRF